MARTITRLLAFFLLASTCQAQAIFRAQNGSGALSLNPGWTFIQGMWWTCSSSPCTTPLQTAGGNFMLPTTAGSVWVAVLLNGNSNITISTVCTGTGTCASSNNGWTLLPSSEGHHYNSGNDDIDTAYTLSGTAGTTQITVTMSGTLAGTSGIAFYELLPPSGATAQFDTAGATGSDAHGGNCSSSCTGVGLTLGGTDAVIEFYESFNTPGISNPTSWSGNFLTDNVIASGLYLNAPSGSLSAPTFAQTSSSFESVSAIAFKTSSSFTSPTPVFTLVGGTSLSGTQNTQPCSTTCTLTIPSTGTGHLGILFVASYQNTSYLSSVTGGGTWASPPTAGRIQNTPPSGSSASSISFAYVLSTTSGTTSLSISMTANSSNTAFVYYEFARTGGSFVLDQLGTFNNASGLYIPSGVGFCASGCAASSLSGSNDIILHGLLGVGGLSESQYYPTSIQQNAGMLFAGSSAEFFAASIALMNTANGTAPTFSFDNGPAFGSMADVAVAFK